MKKWLANVKQDFVTKEFIPLKILHFLMIGGMTTLFPFLTIQARSLGITGTELGIIYSLLPISGIFAPSIAGLLADKIGNFKIFLSLTVACSGLAALLFLFIPAGRIEHTLPKELPLTINCTMNGNVVTVDTPFSCEFKNDTERPLVNVQHCSYTCREVVQQEHLINELMSNWCDRTNGCHVEGQVEIKSFYGEDENTTQPIYLLKEKQKEALNGSLNLRISNQHLPLELRRGDDKTELGINQLFCPDFKQFINSNKEFYSSVVREESERKECWMECKASTDTPTLCSNTKSTETLDPLLTISLYIVIRLLNSLTLATSFTLFEGAVVAVLKEFKGDLGLQRMYGNLGMIALTPISGKMIDYFSELNGLEDYRPAFYLYCGIKLLCAFILLFLNLEFKHPSNRVLKDFKELITQPRVSTFILFTAVAGTAYGFVETFLFWLLEDLGADKSLMGITITVGAGFGIPLLMTSSFFIKKLGHVNTQCLCMAIYVIRLVGYSLIQNPWLAMPFEALESFTNSLLVVSSISYAGVLSSPSTVASLQGIYGGTYHGVGRGIGSLAGGIMIKRVGNAGTFQILAVCCIVASVVYFLINKFIFVRNDRKLQEKEKQSQNNSVAVNVNENVSAPVTEESEDQDKSKNSNVKLVYCQRKEID